MEKITIALKSIDTTTAKPERASGCIGTPDLLIAVTKSPKINKLATRFNTQGGQF